MAGLVLAAGGGSRFGPAPKLLAELRGRPLLEHALSAACAVPELARVVVVLGAHAAELLARVELGRAEPVLCPSWARGQSESLRCGAEALAGAERVIVTLGDAPFVDSALIRRFTREPPRSRAVYAGRPGHPVVLGPDELAALGTLRGDTGARELLAGGRRIECGDPRRARDVDTPDELEAIRNEAGAVVRG